MEMHVLIFRHVPFEGAGRIAPVLEAQGYRLEYADLYGAAAVLPDWRAAAGLVFVGGPMSVNDDLPYLRQELAVLDEALRSDKPVLGVCLGAQLLARAAGARVYPNATKEIGWFPVTWTAAAAQDPLFRGLGAGETVFHWHGETFDLPPGAVHLAQSQACRNQAFRVGRAAYGLQFHLDVTPEMIEDWCRQPANCGDVRELPGPIDSTAHAERLQELAATVFGRWGAAARSSSQNP